MDILIFSLFPLYTYLSHEKGGQDEIELEGGCHCGSVRFKMRTKRRTAVWICNCSICTMKQNHHIIVGDESFTLLKGRDKLGDYRFGSRTAQHLFCTTCGVCSFYKPRSNPDGIGVTLYCIDDPSKLIIKRNEFDGQNWEQFYATSAGSKIKRFSAAKDQK